MNNLLINNLKKNIIRNPNIDLIRIVGMFAIVISHLLFHGRALFKYKKYYQLNLLKISCMWHVSSFGIVSGLVGIKNPKFSNLLNLWILVVFYSFIFYFIFNISSDPNFKTVLISNLYPVIYTKYWYFTAYFGSFPFLSFIISGLSTLSQIQIKKNLYFIIGIFIIWSSYNRDVFHQNNGHSPFSLMIYYFFGSYISKYIFFMQNSKLNRIIIVLICIAIFMFISWFSYNIYIKEKIIKNKSKLLKIFNPSINSLSMIFQAFVITICIAQIKFNKIFSKITTFIGPLTFDVYLIHENLYIRHYFIKKSFDDCSDNLYLAKLYLLIVKKSIILIPFLTIPTN